VAPYHLDADQHEGWHEKKPAEEPLPAESPPEPSLLKRVAYAVIAIGILAAVIATQPSVSGGKGEAGFTNSLLSSLDAAITMVADSIRTAGGVKQAIETKPNQTASDYSNYQPYVSTPTPNPCECPATFDPVCGSDGITYNNTCLAACALVVITAPTDCETARAATPRPPVAPYGDAKSTLK